MLVMDGTNLVLGRAASHIAKKLLQGEEIQLLNAEKIIITGDKASIVENYMKRRRARHKGTPEHSPHWPRMPHLLVKRIVRGMLPWKSSRGKQAFKRLRIYAGNPKNLTDSISLESAKLQKPTRFISIGELCTLLGYKL